MRHPASDKRILNNPVCVDDVGFPIYKCQYTKKYVSIIDASYLGTIMAKVIGAHAYSPNATHSYKMTRNEFNKNDKNCNFCKNLQRIPHDKNKAGFLYGKCIKGNLVSQHKSAAGVIMFHPGGRIGILCWKSGI